MKIFWLATAFACIATTAQGAVKTMPVEYKAGDTTLKGMIAYDDAIEGKRPGVMVVHEWWGMNDYARRRASMLAELGYVAFAIDMFGDGKTTEHPKEAGEWAGMLTGNMELMTARFNAAHDVLKKNEHVIPDKIAAIGYCMGGTALLKVALNGADLDAAVTFHAGLFPDPQQGPVKASILVCHGAADGFIPDDVVSKFQENLAAAGADYEFIAFGGAVHSFTNPDADKRGIPGIKYDEKADRRSWAAMKVFLEGAFK